LLAELTVQELEFPAASVGVMVPLEGMHNYDMFLQMPTAQKLPLAHITFKLLLPAMNLHVFPQVFCSNEALVANKTHMRPFRTVNQNMTFQV
jgi:hypothetical protein